MFAVQTGETVTVTTPGVSCFFLLVDGFAQLKKHSVASRPAFDLAEIRCYLPEVGKSCSSHCIQFSGIQLGWQVPDKSPLSLSVRPVFSSVGWKRNTLSALFPLNTCHLFSSHVSFHIPCFLVPRSPPVSLSFTWDQTPPPLLSLQDALTVVHYHFLINLAWFIIFCVGMRSASQVGGGTSLSNSFLKIRLPIWESSHPMPAT